MVGSIAFVGAGVRRAVQLRKARRRSQLVDAWRHTAQRLGLVLEVGPDLRMYGSIGSVNIRVETAQMGTSSGLSEVTRFHLEDPKNIPMTFRMRRRFRTGWMLEERERSGLSTGDAALDTLTVVQGNEVRLAAVLDQKTRELVRLAVGMHGAAVGYGRITHRELGHIASERRLIGVLHMLCDLAEALMIEDAAIPRALDRNLADPVDGIRRKSFQLLFEYFPDSPEARTALPIASADPDPVVRLAAALGRGVDGLPQIVGAIDEPSVSVALKLYAIRQLAMRYRGAVVEDTLSRLLSSPFTSVVSAALRAIAASERRELLPEVLEMLRDPRPSNDLLVDAVAALGAIGDASVESDLIELLHHPNLRVRLASAYTLGLVGTLSSIEHLTDCAGGLFTHRAVKESARRAIRRIQERFGAAGAGLLSLVEQETGELSLASAAVEGGLSFE